MRFFGNDPGSRMNRRLVLLAARDLAFICLAAAASIAAAIQLLCGHLGLGVIQGLTAAYLWRVIWEELKAAWRC